MGNLFFGASSYLALGSPSHQLEQDYSASAGLSAAQQQCADRYEDAARELGRLGAVPLSSGRKPLLQRLESLRQQYSRSGAGPPAAARVEGPPPLQASRLDFPEHAGVLPLEEVNSGELREALLDPSLITLEAPRQGASLGASHPSHLRNG